MIIKIYDRYSYKLDLSNPIMDIKFVQNHYLTIDIISYDMDSCGLIHDREVICNALSNACKYASGDKYKSNSGDYSCSWEIIPEESDLKVSVMKLTGYIHELAYRCNGIAYFGEYDSNDYVFDDIESFNNYKIKVIDPYIQFMKEVKDSEIRIRKFIYNEESNLRLKNIDFDSEVKFSWKSDKFSYSRR